jgi:aryl-alcohol dehydrogenase-like predicted oxidoreductase
MDWQKLNRIALGTTKIGLEPDRPAGYRLLDAFLDLGGDIVDTAEVYSNWAPGELNRSETIIGEWLAQSGRRNRVFLITKGGHPPLSGTRYSRLDPASLRTDVEGSLRRLQTDHIDLYFLHRDDATRPVAEIMGTLQPYVDRGQIGAVGCSNWQPARIAEARAIMGEKLAASQILGNVLSGLMNPNSDPTLAKLDSAALAQARAEGLMLMLFTSQAQGALTKLNGALPPDYDNPACRAAIADLQAIAKRLGVDVNALGVAFLLQLAPEVVTVIGPRNVEQLENSLLAVDVRLDAATMAEISRISGYI